MRETAFFGRLQWVLKTGGSGVAPHLLKLQLTFAFGDLSKAACRKQQVYHHYLLQQCPRARKELSQELPLHLNSFKQVLRPAAGAWWHLLVLLKLGQLY